MTTAARHWPAPPPKAVIFDIGRVIVRLNLRAAFASFVPAVSATNGSAAQRLSPEQIWMAIQSDSRWRDWQEGRLTAEQWHEHITRRLGIALTLEDFRGAWNRTLDPQTILPDNLFAQLATRCRLALLSNTDPIHVEELETCFSFVHYFPVRIYSNQVGASKPSPKIYQAALSALRVKPAEALYIDDIAEYAESARKLGLDAIHFEAPEQLYSELSQRNLPSGSTGVSPAPFS